MTPPSEQPPLDDEDHDNLEEGSGQPPQVDDFYKILHNSKGTGLHEAERENKNNQREKEMHHPTSSTFCSPPCWKSCPTGFKVDEVRGCQKCKCRKCPSMRGCQQQCPGGLEQDHHGCRTCHCQSPKLSIFTSAHDDFTVDEVSGNGVYTTAQTNPPCNTTRITGCNDGQTVYPVGVKWRRGPCVSCGCVAPGYTECNITQCAQAPCSQQHRDSTTMQDAAEPCCPPCTDMAAKVETNQDQRHDGQNRSRVFLDHIPITHSHNHVPTSDGLSLRGGTSVGASDGMTKSAVQKFLIVRKLKQECARMSRKSVC
ncbi:uncharacterized protein [Panulirus ornatus]|uniref:uncharacterized protein isoform X2 n=1 Tax=Panulirus ornatus TaxID=150431 RepID=UPI003A84DE85